LIRRIFLLGALALSGGLSGCSVLDSIPGGVSADNPLLQTLTDQIGLDAKQATGGVGSILSLASNSLQSGQFDQIAQAIPGAEGYLAAAKQLVGSIDSVAELNSAFSSLGISSADAGRLVPAVTDFVGQSGGENAGDLLAGVLR